VKKIGTYTCRGKVTADSTVAHRIIMDDGNFKTAYRLKSFRIAVSDMDNTNVRVLTAKLSTTENPPTNINWNWDNQTEIGWAIFSYDANGPGNNFDFSQVDEDQLIMQDLFIIADEPAAGTLHECNYWMEFEKYEITDWQGALAMARDKSSGGD
jgi:hypothetical protein